MNTPPSIVDLAQNVNALEKAHDDAKDAELAARHALHQGVADLIAATAAKDPMDATPAPAAAP